jgi:hypothetical protein
LINTDWAGKLSQYNGVVWESWSWCEIVILVNFSKPRQWLWMGYPKWFLLACLLIREMCLILIFCKWLGKFTTSNKMSKVSNYFISLLIIEGKDNKVQFLTFFSCILKLVIGWIFNFAILTMQLSWYTWD